MKSAKSISQAAAAKRCFQKVRCSTSAQYESSFYTFPVYIIV